MKGTPGLWLVMLALPGWLCGGCRTAEMTMLCVSRLKSPVTVATPGLNKPFTPAELEQAQIDRATLKPSEGPAPALVNPNAGPPLARVDQARLDAGADLRQKDRLVIVCLSGGGARAARMAAHTLACLEQKYNRQYPAAAADHPLAGQIDAWSSISGGSLYASFVARQLLRDQGARTNTFALLASQGRARWGTQGLGGMAALYYLWPGNLGYGPLMQFFTDWDTLDLFVHTLALCHEGGFPFLPSPRMSKLGELPVRPRFFFNATCRETSRPFIFTQSVVHRDLSGDPLARLTQDPLLRWIQGQPTPPNELNEPFRYASTLEDLGSPPNRFPLAYAAMASAAFPGIFEPLRLHRYWLATNATAGPSGHPKLWRLRTEVTLADGGLYDNSGLTTALEFFDYLGRASTRPKKLVLLAIDANNQPEGYTGARAPSRSPFHYGLPFRAAAAAVATVSKMYNSQQALVAAAINHRLEALEQAGRLEACHLRLKDALKLIPTANDVSMRAKLRRLREHAAKQPWSQIQALSFFGLVQDIPTDFVLSNQEDEDLRGIVERLLEWKHQANAPSLAERFLQAVAEASSECAQPN